MVHRFEAGQLFKTLTVSALLAVSSASLAGDAQKKPALAISAGDPTLNWAPCPAFLPKGCGIAVLQGDPAKRNADVFFRVPANATIPRHWHTSAERMVLVAGELHLTYDGQKTMVLRPGTYIYGPARLPHEGYCAKGEACVLFIAFEEPVDAIPIAGTPGS
jgi:uncharacterized RmlC-like cupin family protein